MDSVAGERPAACGRDGSPGRSAEVRSCPLAPAGKRHSSLLSRARKSETHRVNGSQQVHSTLPLPDLSPSITSSTERLHEAPEPRLVYQPPHSTARSKLTSLRIKALYREWAESLSDSASFS